VVITTVFPLYILSSEMLNGGSEEEAVQKILAFLFIGGLIPSQSLFLKQQQNAKEMRATMRTRPSPMRL